MEKKIPMTEKSYLQLQEELRHLKQVERPAVIRAIADAREHGDLSENAEYHAAKDHVRAFFCIKRSQRKECEEKA
jgi:transcription elongation factor GreA